MSGEFNTFRGMFKPIVEMTHAPVGKIDGFIIEHPPVFAGWKPHTHVIKEDLSPQEKNAIATHLDKSHAY